MRSGKPWTLHADEQTRAVLAACIERKLSNATETKYQRAYDNLRTSGQTPLDAATTRAHWDFLRTASRFCMERDVRALRAASEHARKRGDIDEAQRQTETAFRLAAVMDELFLQPNRRTWALKAAELRAAGIPPVSKSKRSTKAPPPNVAVGALLSRQPRVQERHAERLAVLALTGCRPAELQAGVSLRVGRTQKGQLILNVAIHGAKWDGQGRGQQARALTFPADIGAAAALALQVESKGGQWTLKTTAADTRSLNRALKAGAGLSCYAFRHQFGSELKEQVSSGALTATDAAAAMGHGSTASLAYYGSRSNARGGRKLRARASGPVRVVPVSFTAKAAARDARAAQTGAPPRTATRPPAAPRAAMSKAVGPLARGPKPPR